MSISPVLGLVLAGVAVLLLVAIGVTVVVTSGLRRRATGRATRPDADPAASTAAGHEQAGSSRTVADAVTRALAAREARGGDARDRLLTVLLDDPVRAVGATADLDACRRQLDRLTGAVEHERADLRSALTRLDASGLSEDQITRLAGLPRAEVRELLAGNAVEPG